MNTYPFAHMKVNKRDLTYREDRLSSIENISLFFDLDRIYARSVSFYYIYLSEILICKLLFIT